MAELRAARQWCIDNDERRKTPRGMPAFLSRWLAKAQNAGKGGTRRDQAQSGGRYRTGNCPKVDRHFKPAAAADSATVLSAIDSALDTVAETRAELGANIERFEFRADNLASQQEALVAARSALQDSDLGAAVTQSVAASVQFEGQAFAVAQANRSAQQLLSVLG